MRLLSLATLAMAVVACGGSAPVGTSSEPEPSSTVAPATGEATLEPTVEETEEPTLEPSASPTEELTPTPSPTPMLTPRPTARPTAPPAPTSEASKLDPILLVWSSDGYVTAQVILPVVNTGGVWIELDEYGSQFTIFDSSGGIVETTSFDSAAPAELAPGETGYLVGEIFTDEYPRGDFVSVEADGYFGDIDPVERLTVENTRIRGSSLDGVEVTGQVVNPGTERVDNADVVAIFFDSSDAVVGYAYGYAENIEPGAKRAFSIDSSFAEIRPADIERAEFYASPW